MSATHVPFHSGVRRQRAFTLIELLVTIAVIGILAALSLAALSRAKAKAHNVTCLSQLRQLGIATRLYAEENNGRLPAAEYLPSNPDNPQKPRPRICDVLGPYVGRIATTNGSSPVFKCPADKGWFFEAEGSSYQWNTALNGRPIDLGHSTSVMVGFGSPSVHWMTNYTLARAPESTVLLLDYDDFHLRPPKSGKNAVYMEGHATTLELPRPPPPRGSTVKGPNPSRPQILSQSH